jgi:S-adenosylmethionine:tRNA ribosyltransferase-isomerase
MSSHFIATSDFLYDLPNERIAYYPLEKRDEAKLLVYQKNQIATSQFKYIADYLPCDTLLIFNETKVIPARLIFSTQTGAKIELFCLEKINESTSSNTEKWLCYIGRAAKWKSDTLQIENADLILEAKMIVKRDDAFIIEFNWNDTAKNFLDVLSIFGQTPLPPYIKRTAEEIDKQTYQTVFAKQLGSVAAPTAGLHFTEEVLAKLKQKGIESATLTLHVGAGTFKPIKTDNVLAHEMHPEWIDVPIQTIESLGSQQDKPIVPIGTTALRTIETLYWLGVKAHGSLLLANEHIYFKQWEYLHLNQDFTTVSNSGGRCYYYQFPSTRKYLATLNFSLCG